MKIPAASVRNHVPEFATRLPKKKGPKFGSRRRRRFSLARRGWMRGPRDRGFHTVESPSCLTVMPWYGAHGDGAFQHQRVETPLRATIPEALGGTSTSGA